MCQMFQTIERFSFDVRGRAFSKALNWSDSTVVGPRAYFVTMTRPATLSLEAVQLDDEGIYRCRVDFKNSPTKNFQVNLTVIGTEGWRRNESLVREVVPPNSLKNQLSQLCFTFSSTVSAFNLRQLRRDNGQHRRTVSSWRRV